jgi:hypothetical protein
MTRDARRQNRRVTNRVDVGVHQVEAFPFNEPPEPARVRRADASLDQLVEERSNRYVRLFQQTMEISSYGAGHGDLVTLAVERQGQVDDVPLGAPDLERVDDQQQPDGLNLQPCVLYRWRELSQGTNLSVRPISRRPA